MGLIDPVPSGSIYVWCYVQGLKGGSWDEILSALSPFNIIPREKDHRNWEDGMKRHLGTTYIHQPISITQDLIHSAVPPKDKRILDDLSTYDDLTCAPDEYEDTRWVPCSLYNKPLVAWSETRQTLDQAMLWPGCRFLAENLKGCRWIVLDFDIDHDENNIDWELREFGQRLLNDFPTQALFKPDWMGFHLTYFTTKEIATRHLPHINMDVCGNATHSSGQLRYFKSKEANDVRQMGILTDEVWKRIQDYSLTREVLRKVKNNEPIN